MKAARQTHFNEERLYVQDIPVPEPHAHQVLARTEAASLCHTDLDARAGKYHTRLPYTPSHEAVGVVTRVGSAVTRFRVGDRVGALAFQGACGNCPDCANGTFTYCAHLDGLFGLSLDGGFAEYFVSDDRFTVPVPTALAAEQAAPLMCAGTTVYAAIRKALRACGKAPADVLLAIVGVGGLGHLGVQMAKALGVRVAALDSRDEPLQLVQNFGPLAPDVVVNTSRHGAAEAARQVHACKPGAGSPTVSLGPDAVVCVAPAPAAFRYAADVVCRHGTLVVVGQPSGGITFDEAHFTSKDITVVGSLLGTCAEAEECMDLVVQHSIFVKVHTYPLERINDMYADSHAADTVGRYCVKFAA